jgi:ATP-dependent Clp protease ATP-binding subunit ClpC
LKNKGVTAMFERFTERARKVIILAREETARLRHEHLGTEHLLLGIIREGGGIAVAVLQRLGVELTEVRLEVEKRVARGTRKLTLGEIPFTPRAKRVLELSIEEAALMGHNYIGTEHILLGLIREGEGIAASILEDLRVDLSEVRQEIISFVQQSTSEVEETRTPALDEFGIDLTRLAVRERLDPVIGRDAEIERVIQILIRRTKNNPVLIGEAGVGKTAIVEGLAQRIVNNSVPRMLANKRLVTLDLGSLVAGTKYRGQFEERIKNVMKEIIESDNIILFIDEMHTLVGAGAAEGSMDASNLLKPALSRGELQCIGATTLNEYRKYVEKDRALERRFQTIMVAPPSVEETIEVISGLKDKYEAHHRVKITTEAIEAAAKLSDRYITDRFLPDKAIDVIDEAGARSRLKASIPPNEIKELEEKIEGLAKQKEMAVSAQEFENAARLRDKERKLKEKLDALVQKWRAEQENTNIVVTDEDVAHIVSKWTGIPLFRLEEREYEKLARMEEALHQRVVGQDEAIAAVSRAIKRSRLGLKNPRKPVGSFIFLGPSGVGKTELARALAEFLFGDENALISIDMSEYTEKFAISRLTGAPPGYVGYDEGGQLTEQVRRRPYCVILLDEIEKAHPDVFNILLQVLEDGHLTDNMGRVVDFKNSVLIMTSNIGARLVEKGGVMGFKQNDEQSSHHKMKERITGELKNIFNPEFLNRVDEVIVFHTLTKKHIGQIISLLIDQLNKQIEDKGIRIELARGAKEWLIREGYNPSYGARPLRRAIQRNIEDGIADEILRGRLKKRGVIRVGVRKDKLVFAERAVVSAKKHAVQLLPN